MKRDSSHRWIPASIVTILYWCDQAHADPGLGGLMVFQYLLIIALIIVAVSFLIGIPCAIRAYRLKQNAQTGGRRYKILIGTILVCLLVVSPVFSTMAMNPQLGIIVNVIGYVYFAVIAGAIYRFVKA